MHLMFLGIVKSATSCLIRFSKIFDVGKLLSNSIAINMEYLTKIGIEFMLKEIIKDEKYRAGYQQIILD